MNIANKNSDRMAYGPSMLFTFDRAPEKAASPAVDADTAAKIERALRIIERMFGEDPERTGASDKLAEFDAVLKEIASKHSAAARRKKERDKLEEVQAAYSDRNPHKRSPGIECSDKPHIRKDGRFGYEYPEERVAVPAKYFEDSARMEAENAYAARNPHKR